MHNTHWEIVKPRLQIRNKKQTLVKVEITGRFSTKENWDTIRETGVWGYGVFHVLRV